LVLAVSEQGSTLMTLLAPRGCALGKGDGSPTVKIHEPKVVVPSAVLPSLVIANVGFAAALVNATVVGPVNVTAVVVPSVPEKPLPKETTVGVAVANAATDVDVTAAEVSVDATVTAAGESLPPPQAASVAANVRPKANFVNLTLVTGNFCIFKPLFKLMN